MPRKAAALELKAHQLSGWALELLDLEGVIAGEGGKAVGRVKSSAATSPKP